MSTTTTNLGLIKPALTDPADITTLNANWDKIDSQIHSINSKPPIPVVNITSSNGTSYTATLDGLTEYYVGLKLTIIPNRVSATKTPTLNINSLGSKNIIMPIDGMNTSATTNAAPLDNWLGANQPVDIMYDGTRWKAEVRVQSASYLYGEVPVDKGGTGATTADGALSNLGAAKSNHTHSTSDITSGTLPIEKGGTGATTVEAALTNLGVCATNNIGDLYIWRKVDPKISYGWQSEVSETVLAESFGTETTCVRTIQYASDICVYGNKINLVSPSTVEVGYGKSSSEASAIKGKYIKVDNKIHYVGTNDEIIYGTEQVTTSKSENTTRYRVYIPTTKSLMLHPIYSYVVATKKTAYSSYGTGSDGYFYILLGRLGDLLGVLYNE